MKRNTFSVLCYARKREQGKDKQYPIMVRITIDSEQVQFNSQLMVDKKMWKDGGVVGRSATAVYLRTQIEKIKTDITHIYEKEIENNRYPSPLKLKNIYLGIETKANTLLTVFKKMNEEKRKEVGTSLSQNTYKKYDLTYRRMEEYIQFRFRKEKYKDIPLTEINEEFINGFRNFLRVDKKVGHNATSKMMQLFKKAVTRARNAGLIQFNPFTQPITFVQVDKGFLTMDELQSIMDKEIEVERLQRVRDVFVFSCWTGLAYIDVYLLKDEHIQKYLERLRDRGQDRHHRQGGAGLLREPLFRARRGQAPVQLQQRTLGSRPADRLPELHQRLRQHPRLIEKYTRDNADIEKEIPVLKQVVDETWKKEDELKQLKAELAALDRWILLSLKSVDAQEANTEGVTEIRPEPQAPSVAQPAPSMPGNPAVPASSEPYIHRMPDYMEHAAEHKPPVLHAMPKSISIKELMSAGKEKGMTDGIPQPEDGTEKPQEKPKWRMKL